MRTNEERDGLSSSRDAMREDVRYDGLAISSVYAALLLTGQPVLHRKVSKILYSHGAVVLRRLEENRRGSVLRTLK